MIKVVNSKQIDTNDSFVGTHNGIFHCDEVIAIALLDMVNSNSRNTCVIRSRDIEFLSKNTDILVDVGKGDFDHHQKGGNGKRKSGVKYASAGLIWKQFGNYLVSMFSNHILNAQDIRLIADTIDKNIIQKIDLEDNGELASTHPFQFIKSFLPNWNQEANYDEKFEQCANVVRIELENIIKTHIARFLAPGELVSRINNPETHFENILLIPNQTFPWEDGVINYNSNSEAKIDFVIFPYPDGGFALQCVPKSLDDKFSQRIPLPASWAGETDKLPEISGIPSAIRCHNGRFFARAEKYNDIITMCQIATRKFLENQNSNTR